MVNELILCYGVQDDINNDKQKQSCSDLFFPSKAGFRTKLLREFGVTLSMIHTFDQQRAVVWHQCYQTLWLSTALANVSRMEKDLPFTHMFMADGPLSSTRSLVHSDIQWISERTWQNKMCDDLKTFETSLQAGCVTSQNVSTANMSLHVFHVDSDLS